MPSTLWPRIRAFSLMCLVMGQSGVTGCRKNPDEQAAPLMKDIDLALAQQQWETALQKAQEATKLPGLSDGLRDQVKLKEEQARSEQQAKLQYARFVGSADTDHDAAMAAYRDLPATSTYRIQGKDAYDKLRPVYVGEHLEKAQAALTNGRCDDAKNQLQLVVEIDGANAKALELGKQSCTPRRD